MFELQKYIMIHETFEILREHWYPLEFFFSLSLWILSVVLYIFILTLSTSIMRRYVQVYQRKLQGGGYIFQQRRSTTRKGHNQYQFGEFFRYKYFRLKSVRKTLKNFVTRTKKYSLSSGLPLPIEIDQYIRLFLHG